MPIRKRRQPIPSFQFYFGDMPAGMTDKTAPRAFAEVFAAALDRGLPVLCSNPDRPAPRAGGVTVVMPGTLAERHAGRDGDVLCTGKPHTAVFLALERVHGLSSERILMVGDSLEHDIAGARRAGWASLFIWGGLHAGAFRSGTIAGTIAAGAGATHAPPPDFTLDTLR